MKIKILLISLFLISLFLRFYLLPQNLFFGPEQGIDFMAIKHISIDHKLTLIGAKTDVSGVFHGPIYYYLSVIPFLLSQGNPLIISIFFILLNSLSIFLIYHLGKIIGGKRVGVIAALLFTISFETIIYPRWLSAHPLAIPLSTLFFLFFYRFLEGSKKNLLFAAITLGLLNQVEFLHIVFFTGITLVLFIVYLKKLKNLKKTYLLLCIFSAFIITTGTYILFDIKHDFLISRSILSLAGGTSGYHINILQTIIDTWISIVRVYMETIFPINFPVAYILFLGSVILLIFRSCHSRLRRNPTTIPLLIWLITPMTILIILRHNILDQFFVSQIPLYLLMGAILIDSIWQKKKILGIITLLLICSANLYTYIKNIPSNSEIFFQSTQPHLRYSDQLATIDDIYKEMKGKPFSFQSYTIPYWTQQGWQYLFWSYGNKKYGYEPITHSSKVLFVIIQDDPSNKGFQEDWLKNTVSKWGSPEKTFKHGILTIIKLKT